MFVERACRERALAQLLRNGVYGVISCLALADVDRKAHPVRAVDRMVLVIREDHFLARRRVGQADPAGDRAGRVSPHRAERGQLGIVEREQMLETGRAFYNYES